MTAPQPPQVMSITPGQKAILDELMRDGADNRTIARRLHLAEDTVKTHLKALFGASGCAHRTSLVVALFRGQIRVEVQAERRRDRAAPTPKLIDHGTWSGFLAHHRRDEPMCDPCQAAGDEQVAKMQAGRKTAAGTTTRHEEAA